MADIPELWQEKDHFVLSIDWLSRANRRKYELQREMLRLAAEGREPDLFTSLSFGSARQKDAGWYHHMRVLTFQSFRSLAALQKAVERIVRTGDLDAAAFELLYDDAPIKLSKQQKQTVTQELGSALTGFDFPAQAKGDIFRHIADLGDYGLEFRVEWFKSREEIGGRFSERDSPLKSLVGLECRVQHLEDIESEDWQDVAEGVFELDGRHLRVGDWTYEVEGDPIVEGTAFEEAYLEVGGDGQTVEGWAFTVKTKDDKE